MDIHKLTKLIYLLKDAKELAVYQQMYDIAQNLKYMEEELRKKAGKEWVNGVLKNAVKK